MWFDEVPEAAPPPRKDLHLTVHNDHPLNVETPPRSLREDFITPVGSFYVRCHGGIPSVDPERYRLRVSGLVERTLELSLEELRAFPKTGFASTLFCAGNRRAELNGVSTIPGKVAWGIGAAGNARWGGVLLRDVLREAGVAGAARHAAFTGLDRDLESGTGVLFGGSVPLQRALADRTLLAYEMNGRPLPPEHGFPLRAVVGGYVGARSVKWLSEVTLQTGPSDNYYQTVEYKLFPPHVTAENADYSGGEVLGEVPLNAVICTPEGGEQVTPGPASIKGYAIAGGDRRVERVEVSVDGTWFAADFTEGGEPGAWRFWEAAVDLAPGPHEIAVRAFDSDGGGQPAAVEETWNFLGYANNAWHGIRIEVAAPGAG